MIRTCPSCDAESSSGSFCSSCGASLADPTCPSCDKELPAGARFCNACGASTGQAADRNATSSGPQISPPRLPWLIAGAAVAALLAIVLIPREAPDPADGPPAAPVAPAGDPSAVDISSMTPQERADRLFNRVMQSVSTGDTAQAQAFLPMALASYAQVPDLDLDGRYHLAILHMVGDDPRAARAQTDSILEAEPSHLFGLFTAAQAEEVLGNRAEAEALYRRFLESYDAEVTRDLPEYRDHAQVLPINREEAERRVGGR